MQCAAEAVPPIAHIQQAVAVWDKWHLHVTCSSESLVQHMLPTLRLLHHPFNIMYFQQYQPSQLNKPACLLCFIAAPRQPVWAPLLPLQ